VILRSLHAILRSLRARVFAGALLWTVGLFVLVRVASEVAADAFPGFRPVDHLVLSLLGTACAIAGMLIAAGGLRRLDRVRAQVSAVRAGEEHRLHASGLTEIEPLVRDMNELLEHRETLVRRAIATAGDLAHGLKTPLAIMAQEVDRLEALRQHESAATIAEQVQRMQRQVDYHLVRARASGAGSTYGRRSEVGAATKKLVNTMCRLYASRSLAFEVIVAETLTVRCEPEDFEEMLGNLLDNACKWASSTVVVTATRSGDVVMLLVDDDGPGIDPSMLDRVVQRGARADEDAPGHGLGLAIASDLTRLYRGSLALEQGDRGGLRARLVLPSGPLP
jgi:signal transduction histidine kinase